MIKLKFYSKKEKTPKHDQEIIYLYHQTSHGCMESVEIRHGTVKYFIVDDATNTTCGYTDEDISDPDIKIAMWVDGNVLIDDDFLWIDQEEFWKQFDNEQQPFAWATFDGEGCYNLRLFENNENYLNDFIAMNGQQYANWVFPLFE